MKKILLVFTALALTGGLSFAVQADPQTDLKQFRDYFKKKFPTVPFDEYSNGLYALPGNEEARVSWEGYKDLAPYEAGLEDGKKTWEKPFKNGKTLASCFKNGGKNIAQGYPYWDEAKKMVRTVELDINDCLKKNGEKEFTNLDKDQKTRVHLANLVAHFYSMSKGQRIKIDLSKPGAVAAYEDGKQFWWAKRGQLNFSCADCHATLAGKNFGGGQPLSAGLGHTTAWPAQRYGWARLETIHQRYSSCNSQVRAAKLKHNSEQYRNLQLYETFMSSGLRLTAPDMRN
jgi:sulfur-oxidizing protein SoxA